MSSFSPPSSSLFGLLWLLLRLSPKGDMSHNFSRHWLSQLPARCHFSHIKILDGVKNAVFGSLGTPELIQRSTWKSYVRKSASIAAEPHSCSQILCAKGGI